MKPFYVRELSVYPVGRRRIFLLAIAVLASLVANFETTIATILPLLMEDLGMSLTVYGQIAALSVLVGGLSAGFGGILSDRWGRVTILVPTLTITAACNFLLATVDSVAELFWIRCLMLFIEGAGITITASLVRDFSPRMGRAQAFAFWTWGPVGASFLASFIAGFTLPLFGNAWQSQAIIMGVVSLAMCGVIIWKIAEPSGALRAEVLQDEVAVKAEGRADHGRVRQLFRHPHLWAHVFGNTGWQVLYWTFAIFGQTMLTGALGMEAAAANRVVALGIVLNAVAVVIVGRVSDRIQLRKPFTAVGTVLTVATLAYFISLIGPGVSAAHVTVVFALLYLFMGVAYVPWMANFSENAEDVEPRLQGSALGIWGMVVRVMIVVLLIVSPLVVEVGGWQTWLGVALAGQLVFLASMAAYKGRWRTALSAPAPQPAD
ncbi:OPA family glycerol-3-phosphate transporter-like MFS transporter [Nonomuraea polychroma]|uniref:OPA family glycerol-3-phosphate transporter-like MFS transporter n=1 Tax=Nonomuraea polychroma TaxID=46176 RepID=A0A438M9Z4_9ACTN|nr:MFS transporter [Nonomuraea polychroma]RVX42542.1 OPA family glycerol-3-phosphate transporter-like MFS transporter [Nonomuraea polychroma]